MTYETRSKKEKVEQFSFSYFSRPPYPEKRRRKKKIPFDQIRGGPNWLIVYCTAYCVQ